MRLTFTGSAKALLGVLLLAWVVTHFAGHGLSGLFTSADEYSARERVRRILDGLKPGGDLQGAICLWSTGTLIAPGEAFNVAEDRFRAWHEEKGITSVSDYNILEARLEGWTTKAQTPGTGVVRVSVRVNGKEHAMRVVPGQSIQWVQ